MGKGRDPYTRTMDSPGRGNLHNGKNDTPLKATGSSIQREMDEMDIIYD